MQLSNCPDLIDCISAKQLLHALNTLQKISENNEENEVQLSFSQQGNSLFNTNNNAKMNFQIYMAMKNKNQKLIDRSKSKKQANKSHQSHIIKKKQSALTENEYIRKSITPRKQNITKQNKNIKPRMFQTKSKSNQNKILKDKSCSQIKQNKQKQNMKNIVKSIKKPSVHLYNPKKPKQNKENILFSQQNNIQQITPVKISQKSKKIMIERQKKGKTYIPIQQRTSQLIKQKQEKIAKIQRANLAQKQFEQRQCTFKPSINNSFVKVNNSNVYSTGIGKTNMKNKQSKHIPNRHRIHTVGDQVVYQQSFDNGVNVLSFYHNSIESQEKSHNEKLVKIQRLQTEHTQSSSFKFSNQSDMIESQSRKIQKQKQRPKNQKFNILLDLIN